MSPKQQGYFLVLIAMSVWGGFTLLSRLNAAWHISPWDITALRFGLAFVILVPILLIQRQYQFLWSKTALLLAFTGGLGYCLTVYSAFILAPAAHAAIFLNGPIPLFTALAAWLIYRQPFDQDMWISLTIMLLSLTVMGVLMAQQTAHAFGWGDVLYLVSAMWWGIFTVLLRRSNLTAWQSMCSVAIWSAVIYVPVYILFIPKHLAQVAPLHLLAQTLYHGILVVIVATMCYAAAIQRLGAFTTGSLVTLAPFIAAILAVPVLGESLNMVIACGLIGMGIGALQPWRWLR